MALSHVQAVGARRNGEEVYEVPSMTEVLRLYLADRLTFIRELLEDGRAEAARRHVADLEDMLRSPERVKP